MISCTYLIIGSGETGLILAEELVKTGQKVILIESSEFGGTYLNSLDYPRYLLSKESQDFSTILKVFKDHPETFSVIKKHRQKIAAKILAEIKRFKNKRIVALEKNKNFKLITGKAEFFSKSLIEVNSNEERHLIGFKHCLIAVGKNGLEKPKINGITEKDFLNQHNIFHFKEIPSRLAIFGCNNQSLEVASIYSGLGVKVIVFEESKVKTCMPELDRTALNHLIKTLSSRQVEFFFDTKIKTIKKRSKFFTITDSNREEHKVSHIFQNFTETFIEDELLLKKVGIKFSKKGIKVTASYKTSLKNVYAFGDCQESNDNYSQKQSKIQEYLKTQLKDTTTKTGFTLGILDTYFSPDQVIPSGISILEVKSFSPVLNIGCSESKALIDFGTYIKTKVFTGQMYEGFMKVVYKENNDSVLGIILAGEFALKLQNFAILALKKSITRKYLENYLRVYWGV